MKRQALLALAASLLLLFTGCMPTSHYYERAHLYLGSGDYRSAARMFRELGEYADAADYALYCDGLAALTDGDLTLARADLVEVEPLGSSSRYLRYLDALELSRDGRTAEALAVWDALGSFADSAAQAEMLRSAMLDASLSEARRLMTVGRYTEADALLSTLTDGTAAALRDSCRVFLDHEAYAAAEALLNTGDLTAAAAAFDALGNTLDAARRARECRETLYDRAEQRYDTITIASATDLMADYAALGDFRQSEARAAALEARFGITLRLLHDAAAHPWVQWSAWQGEPLRWRVLCADGDDVTLLCSRSLPACPDDPAALPAGLPDGCRLPCFAELGLMDAGLRRCDGLPAWWLGDLTPAGTRLLVRGGRLAVSGDQPDDTIGVRPVLTLNADALALTDGDGSEADPFR